ncbi:hypothetical protein XANCAGTX0491_002141 [Xanthoria calcicola]
MPSLFVLALLTVAFPIIPCFTLRVPLEPRLDSDLLRKLPKCQNPPYQYYPAGSMLPPPPKEDPLGWIEGPLKGDAAPTDANEPVILCIAASETFIKLTRRPFADGMDVDTAFVKDQGDISSLVASTYAWIEAEHLPPNGQDGVIDMGEGWIVQRKSPSGTHQLLVANAHHAVPLARWSPAGHGTMKIVGNEITWGVLWVALEALGEFAATHGWTLCEFEIWDGLNQVGTAKLSA